MSRKRVPWDGPNPSPGDYIAAQDGTLLWLVRAVEPLRRTDISGARLCLDVSRIAPPAPYGAVIHPAVRMALSDPTGPPRVRQITGSVMRASWRDPEDMRTYTRRAREIEGYRAGCPLRRMQSQRGSSVTDRHVAAADHLRLLADLAKLGFAASPGVLPIGSAAYGPCQGPSHAAIRQAGAARDLDRCMRRFTPAQQIMLVAVVLHDTPIAAWCRPGMNRQVETGRLLYVLDTLTEHFGTEVDAALAADAPIRAVA